MPALLVVHEVEDVDHWLASPKREQLMGPRGFTVRTFVDPNDPNRVGLLLDGASVEDFQALVASDEAAQAMTHDGVRPHTIRVLEER